MNIDKFINFLKNRFQEEKDRQYRKGIYGFTQRILAYNSNKIEGSTLTEEQTASLFDTGTLPYTDDYYRAKDIEEMSGHFLMFNKMLNTLDQNLTQELIKQFHYELKTGVFEDRANGYAIGEYKTRANMIGIYETTLPKEVASEMKNLITWYSEQVIDLNVIAKFHAQYECIHPFQDGNGRTGRIIIFRECLRHNILPVIIEDVNRKEYIDGLKEWREYKKVDKLIELFKKEQEFYFNKCRYFYDNEL